MKKKTHYKFKPLRDLYSLDDSSVNSKVVSDPLNKGLKIPSIGNSVKLECLTNHTCAVIRPSYEQLSCTASGMEKQVITLSELKKEEMNIDQTSVGVSTLYESVDDEKDLEFGKTRLPHAGSGNSSYSEDVHSLDSSKVSGVTEDLKMQENANTFPTVEHENQDGCDSLGSSCISKENGVVMTTSGEDHRYMACSAASVTDSCRKVLENPVNGQSTTAGLGDSMSHEEGTKCSISTQICSKEPILTIKDSADPSETSSCRHDLEGSTLKDLAFKCCKEPVDLLFTKMVDSNVPSQDSHLEGRGLLKPETGFSDANPADTDSLNKSVGHESIQSDTPLLENEEPTLQSHNLTHTAGSDDLVDVQVCDICGDVGREALLVLCSKCSDGAEHVYCMRVKMDEVPQSGWMCEECMVMQEFNGHNRVVIKRLDNAVSSSCLKQSLPRLSSGVKQVGEKGTSSSLNRSSSLPNKRNGEFMEVKPAPKKNSFEQNVLPSKSPHCRTKTRLTHMSSVNSMNKGQTTALQVSSWNKLPKRALEQAVSSGDRSPRPEKRFCKGYLYKRKREEFSELSMKVKRSKVDVTPKRETIKESMHSKFKKACLKKKLLKSLSFPGVSSVPPEVSKAQSSDPSKVKVFKCGSERELTGKCSVPEKKPNRLSFSSTGSASMKVQSSKAKVVAEISKAIRSSDKKNIQICGVLKEVPRSFSQEKKRHANLSGRSARDNVSTSYSGTIKSPAKAANLYALQKSSHLTPKVEHNDTTKEDNSDLMSSRNDVQHELRPVKCVHTLAPAKMFPSEVSAVPAVECIWKGAFKVKESGELPNHCGGVQAHLSTCASSKVHEMVSQFGSNLCFKVVPQSQISTTQIQNNIPTEQDIALYFFAEDLQSYGRGYKMLLEGLMRKELVLEANFNDVQLLVFPSNLLPVASQRWNSLSFMWGVCRERKVDRNSHLPGMNASSLKHDLYSPNTYGLHDKSVSPVEAGSPCASHTSHNPVLMPEFVNLSVLQSSAPTKSMIQNYELEAACPLKCTGPPDGVYVLPDAIRISNVQKEEILSGEALRTHGMLNGIEFADQIVKHIKKSNMIHCVQLKEENMAPLAVDCGRSGFVPVGLCQSATLPWIHNTGFFPGLDATSCSVSIDSGPSGSSDGCAKSDEQFENPSSLEPLNLDLSLGFSSKPDVDLDLGLGFPSRLNMDQYTRSSSSGNEDKNISLSLSLATPCLNA